MINEMSKEAFTLIRNLLEGGIKGGAQPALELAEIFHNMPKRRDDFLNEMFKDRFHLFISKYPDLLNQLPVSGIYCEAVGDYGYSE